LILVQCSRCEHLCSCFESGWWCLEQIHCFNRRLEDVAASTGPAQTVLAYLLHHRWHHKLHKAGMMSQRKLGSHIH
jgi:hypothetical protein